MLVVPMVWQQVGCSLKRSQSVPRYVVTEPTEVQNPANSHAAGEPKYAWGKDAIAGKPT